MQGRRGDASVARLACRALALAGLMLAGREAAKAADLTVCIDTASATAGRDQAVAESVARRAGLSLAVEHFNGAADNDGMAARQFHDLLATRCQLVMGYPVDTEGGAVPAGVLATKPYAQTGFALVVPAGSPASTLAQLPGGTEVAVTSLTAPNLYFGSHANIRPDEHVSDAETLQSVASGADRAAMVWQPTVDSYLAATPGARLAVYPLAEPHARFDVVALYLPQAAHQAATFDATTIALKTPAPPASTAGEAIPALYTASQAKEGAAKFADNCEQCHGAHLEGRAGPALKGANFASAKSAFSVGDVFTIVTQNMPASNPGSLDPGDYVQIMAFLLQQNGYPAGSTALDFKATLTSKVPLLYHGG